ncbi:MAG: DUF362 domain-containing protein [Anaerolineae bacterium]|jgi:uncharacterized protein (DUF362 family)
MSQVALIHGSDRYDNIKQALSQIEQDLDLSDKQRVLIKPNFVVTHQPLAATHVDAVRAVLDFVRARYDGPITIAEGPSVQPAGQCFAQLGYESLVESHGVTLADLNQDEPVPVDVYDWRLRPLRLHLARSVVESDFRISVGPPKTHDVVIVTLSLKNMIMGSLISRFTHAQPSNNGSVLSIGAISKVVWRMVPRWIRHLPPAEWITFRAMSSLEPSDKMKMHQSYPVINLNLALIAPCVVPHLSVIDGFEAMEGNGPSEGDRVPWKVALASTDALAADVIAATLMGFDPDGVGYLHYCKLIGLGAGDLDQIQIAGNATMDDCARRFRPHDTVHRQRRWQLSGAESYLRPSGATHD